MRVESLRIPDVKLIYPKKFGDDRGFFSETYNKSVFEDAGIALNFVQDNQSLSGPVGVLRGLHFQAPNRAQDKLVRVIRGRILDVAVDIRKGSPTFGEWVSAEISAQEWNQILVPIGFAHGFVTLEENTEVVYKVTDLYSREDDKGLAWDDPDLGIDWGLDGREPILSDKDRVQPRLADLPDYFTF